MPPAGLCSDLLAAVRALGQWRSFEKGARTGGNGTRDKGKSKGNKKKKKGGKTKLRPARVLRRGEKTAAKEEGGEGEEDDDDEGGGGGGDRTDRRKPSAETVSRRRARWCQRLGLSFKRMRQLDSTAAALHRSTAAAVVEQLAEIVAKGESEEANGGNVGEECGDDDSEEEGRNYRRHHRRGRRGRAFATRATRDAVRKIIKAQGGRVFGIDVRGAVGMASSTSRAGGGRGREEWSRPSDSLLFREGFGEGYGDEEEGAKESSQQPPLSLLLRLALVWTFPSNLLFAASEVQSAGGGGGGQTSFRSLMVRSAPGGEGGGGGRGSASNHALDLIPTADHVSAALSCPAAAALCLCSPEDGRWQSKSPPMPPTNFTAAKMPANFAAGFFFQLGQMQALKNMRLSERRKWQLQE